jgi:hypothetical protein
MFFEARVKISGCLSYVRVVRTIIDIENVLNNIDEQSKKGYRIIAFTKLKRMIISNTDSTLHKRIFHITRKLKQKLKDTVEADKGKIRVIIERETLNHKIQTFLRENQYTEITTDPTQKYTKLIKKIISNSDKIRDNKKINALVPSKPTAPKLQARIKVHKDDYPIRPVVNNINSPTHDTTKAFNKILQESMQLPYTYNVHNATTLANNLTELKITPKHRCVTLDVRDLYVNIPIKETVNIVNQHLKNRNMDKQAMAQNISILEAILHNSLFHAR